MISPVGLAIGTSGFVFLALGGFVASMRPRTRANLAFAVYAIAYGLEFVLIGVGASFSRMLSVGVLEALSLSRLLPLWTIGPALVFLAINSPRPLTRRERRFLIPALLVASVFAGVMATAYIDGASSLLNRSLGAGITMAIGGLYFAVGLLTLRFDAAKGPGHERERFETSLLAAALFLQEGMRAGATGSTWSVVDVAGLAAIGLYGLAWLLNTERGGGLIARRVALTAFGAPLAGMLIEMMSPEPGLSFAVGRFVAVILIAYAILRHQLFDIDVKLRWTISRGTIAAAFITVFFIASEGAQILFGAENQWLGLLAAGALVFAIAPLQRAAERLAEKAVPTITAATADGFAGPASSGSREAIFCRAVRLALRDGKLSRNEERELVAIAFDLRLPPQRAFELRDEVVGKAEAGADAETGAEVA